MDQCLGADVVSRFDVLAQRLVELRNGLLDRRGHPFPLVSLLEPHVGLHQIVDVMVTVPVKRISEQGVAGSCLLSMNPELALDPQRQRREELVAVEIAVDRRYTIGLRPTCSCVKRALDSPAMVATAKLPATPRQVEETDRATLVEFDEDPNRRPEGLRTAANIEARESSWWTQSLSKRPSNFRRSIHL